MYKFFLLASMRRLAEHRISLLAITLGVVTLVALSSVIIIAKQQVPGQTRTDLQDNHGLITEDDKANYARGDARIALTVLNHTEFQVVTALSSVTNASTTIENNATIRGNDARGGEEEKKKNDTIDMNQSSNNVENSTTITSVSCGQVLTEDAILSHDLECTGIGMIAGKDGITIQLNSHKLSLANYTHSTIPELENIGILIPNHRNITIVGPGVITGFNKAIEFAGSDAGYISDLKLVKNKIGILLKVSNDIAISSSSVDGNAIGIASQSSRDGKITFNQILQNTDQGIVLMDSDYFIISGNSVIDSGDNGIFLDVHSSNHTLSSNNILNQTIDINNANGVPIDISANKFTENSCRKAVPDGLC
jgi:parallel beta-helix repeat protein